MLVFVHGMLSNADVWNPFLDYFSERGFSCKAVNLKEGLNLRKVHFRDYVDKVKAMVTEEDIIIGHSMGGLIVQKVAEETTIKGGVAICSAPPKGIKFSGRIVLSSSKYALKVIIKESAIVTYELGMNRIAVDEKKVNCPLLFIATKKDRLCTPEMVKRIAEKYNAEYKLYDGCHHFFCDNNWRDIAKEIYKFIMQL